MRRMDDRRVRDVLLVALTVSTGAVDALSWLGLDKVFSAFMTGNLVFLGFRTGGAGGPSVPHVLAAVTAFALGAALAARIVASTKGSRSVWPRLVTVALGVVVVVQGAFVAVWVGVGAYPSSSAGDVRRYSARSSDRRSRCAAVQRSLGGIIGPCRPRE